MQTNKKSDKNARNKRTERVNYENDDPNTESDPEYWSNKRIRPINCQEEDDNVVSVVRIEPDNDDMDTTLQFGLNVGFKWRNYLCQIRGNYLLLGRGIYCTINHENCAIKLHKKDVNRILNLICVKITG